MWFTLLGDDNADSSPDLPLDRPTGDETLRCGMFPTRSPYYAVGFLPFRAQLNFPLCYWDFPNSDFKNLQVPLMGFLPNLEKKCRKLTKSFLCQIKHSEVKDQHPEEMWSIPIRPTVKQTRQDLHNYFHSQRKIHVCIPSLPFRFYPIDFAWLHLTWVIQGSITHLCLHFWRRIQIIQIWTSRSYHRWEAFWNHDSVPSFRQTLARHTS